MAKVPLSSAAHQTPFEHSYRKVTLVRTVRFALSREPGRTRLTSPIWTPGVQPSPQTCRPRQSGGGGSGSGQPHIKLPSHQQVISEDIAQSRPDSLLPVADLRLLALEQVHRHMANHPDIVSSIASTNPTFVFSKCHVQPPMQLVLDTPVRNAPLVETTSRHRAR